MINTLPTWKSQHAANTLSHNDVVRLLGDANEEVARLKAQNAIDSEAASSLFCVIADISLTVGIPDSAPNICRETVKAVKQLTEERDALRAALRQVLKCKVCHGSGVYETKYPPNDSNWDFRRGAWTYIPCECRVNARRVLGEVTS